MESTVVEKFKVIRGVPTQWLKCGSLAQDKPLALIIPGNPGIPEYYSEFMIRLHTACLAQFPIWCVSHAGHVLPPPGIKSNYGTEEICHVFGQIRHKLSFIQSEVPQSVKLLLIGHSIGCFINLHLLTRLPSHQVIKCIQLFPTIERMAVTPNGRLVTPILRTLGWLGSYPVYPIKYFVPTKVKEMLIRWYFGKKNIPRCIMDATLKLLDPTIIHNVFYFGRTEMENVVHADHDIITAKTSKLMFYYGTTDRWCPLAYYYDLKQKHPKADILLCKHGLHHAFVLESSAEMADILWDWIAENVPNIHQEKI